MAETGIEERMSDAASGRVQAWLAEFSGALNAGDGDRATAMFVEDGFWRDFLCFTWNFLTLEGRPAIAAMLQRRLGDVGPVGLALDGAAAEEGDVVSAWITLETGVARGRGHLRLRGDGCWTLLTSMTELKGHEERRGRRRVLGTAHQACRQRVTWQEVRAREQAELGRTTQPYCVIIGGGQGGIALGARLRRLGVPTVIVEKNARAGDSWRNRYRSLVLHDPVWYDHLPYMPFPDNWPVFAPKDKIGDWLEAYAKVMELNYWAATKCRSAEFDDASATWAVRVDRQGEQRVLKPKALVFATGAYGHPRIVDFPGAERFAGESLHSSAYQSGERFRGKRCAVIGSATSAHDIALDLWENGAEVTMIQRSAAIVIRSATLMRHGFGELYSEDALERGITTERADLLFASIPFRLAADFQAPVMRTIQEVDAAFYQRLTGAGFLWDFGVDGSGLLMKALRTASGYYIDVGASELIASGDIKVASGAGIERIESDRIRLADGREVIADVIVQATGYGSMEGVLGELTSPAFAERIGRFWGYGSGIDGDPGPWEGELRNMWKPTTHQALWFHGGNLALSRFHSAHVALQIKARMEGIPTAVYRPAAPDQ